VEFPLCALQIKPQMLGILYTASSAGDKNHTVEASHLKLNSTQMLEERLRRIGKTLQNANLEDIISITNLDVLNGSHRVFITLIDVLKNARCLWRLGAPFNLQSDATKKLINIHLDA
jgi:hypothetical protein